MMPSVTEPSTTNEEQLAGGIGPARSRRPRLGDEAERQDDRGQPQRDVDQEDPGASRRWRRARRHDRPERHRDAEHGAPDADRLSPFARLVNVLVMIDIATGLSIEAPTALEHAGHDEELDRTAPGCRAAEQPPRTR